MPLPASVAAMIRDGLELGHAMDRLIGEHDTKHGKGAVGILTAGLVDRQRRVRSARQLCGGAIHHARLL